MIDHKDPIILAASAGDIGEVSRLADAGTSVNSCDAFGNTALSAALKAGHLDVAREVMRRGFNPILTFHSAVAGVYLEIGRGPLTLAVRAGADDIVDGLLARGLAVFTEFNTDRYSDAGNPVVAAISANRPDLVRKLMGSVDAPLLRFRLGLHSFQYLEPCSSVEIIDFLVSKGLDVNDPSEWGPFPTALHVYAKRGWVDGIKELLALGANPLKADSNHVFPEDVAASDDVRRLLIIAVIDLQLKALPNPDPTVPGYQGTVTADGQELRRHFPREVVVTALTVSEEAAIPLANAASPEDINTPDNRGWTLLNYALKYHYLKLAASLLDRGADVVHLTKAGSSVAAFAEATRDVDMLRRVVKMGAPVDGASHGSSTALTNAIKDEHEGLVAALLALGAKPVHAGMEGKVNPVESSLMAAARKGNIPMMKDLLDAGVDINESDMWDETAVFYAVSSRNTAAVAWLVEKGADLRHVTSRNTNVLTLAADNGDFPMVMALVGMGISHPDAATYAQKKGHLEIANYLRSRPTAGHWTDAAELWNRSTVTTEEVRKYVADGGDVNYAHNCPTPLQRMSIIGDADAVSLLLDHGADPTGEGDFMGSPAGLAMSSRNGTNTDENVLVLLRLFIEHGAPIESTHKVRSPDYYQGALKPPSSPAYETHHSSYLLQALDLGYLKCARYLLDKGANPWFVDSFTNQNAFGALKYSMHVTDQQRYEFDSVLREYALKAKPPKAAPTKSPAPF